MSPAGLVLFLAPRAALGAIWVLTDRVDDAFDQAVRPALGLVLAPVATMLYILLWAQGGAPHGVTDYEWVVVGLGAAVDLAIWVTRLAPPRPV